MKRKLLNIMILMIGSSPILYAADSDPDTTLKQTDPHLLYSTRDFFIAVPNDCYAGQLCLQDVFFVVTFNIGMNSSREIKQIGFKKAGIEFLSKMPQENIFKKQTFEDYSFTSQLDGHKVNVVFNADEDGTNIAPAVKQFVFDATVSGDDLSGMLTFYLKSGEICKIAIN